MTAAFLDNVAGSTLLDEMSELLQTAVNSEEAEAKRRSRNADRVVLTLTPG